MITPPLNRQARLLALLRLFYTEKQSYFIRQAGAYASAIFLLTLISYLSVWTTDANNNAPTMHIAKIVGSFLTIIFFCSIPIAISNTFKDHYNVSRRTLQFMLPAKRTEKYSIRVVSTLFVGILIPIVVNPIIDLLFWGMSRLLALPYACTTTYFFQNITQLFSPTRGSVNILSAWLDVQILIFIMLVFSYIAICATYLLGSTLFRKKAFIVTSLILFCLGITMVFIVQKIPIQHIHYGDTLFVRNDSVTPFLWIFFSSYIIFTTAWIIGCTVWSYRLYTRANVIRTGRWGY